MNSLPYIPSLNDIVYQEYKIAWNFHASNPENKIERFLGGPDSEEVEDVVEWIKTNVDYAVQWGNLPLDEIYRFCAAPLGCPLNWMTHEERISVIHAFITPNNPSYGMIRGSQDHANLIVEKAIKRKKIMSERNDAFQMTIYVDQKLTSSKIRKRVSK